MVIGAAFLAFAPLSLIQTRPPWAIEQKPGRVDDAPARVADGGAVHDPGEDVAAGAALAL
jgi:hypothetical protein